MRNQAGIMSRGIAGTFWSSPAHVLLRASGRCRTSPIETLKVFTFIWSLGNWHSFIKNGFAWRKWLRNVLLRRNRKRFIW
jgi:hypothetical protein